MWDQDRPPGCGRPDAYASWIREAGWEHVATLTFREPGRWPTVAGPHPVWAVRRVDRWRRELERRAGRRVEALWAHELGERQGRLHLHALTRGTEGMGAPELARAWQDGQASVELYRLGGGMDAYMARKLAEEREGRAWGIMP